MGKKGRLLASLKLARRILVSMYCVQSIAQWVKANTPSRMLILMKIAINISRLSGEQQWGSTKIGEEWLRRKEG
jgi:hypothetical protein